ncbi:MAG: hypothetical protein JW941_00430 [Candidatus Coatesbacteria bacterium]|nr:hypothetical protein [Candidatus Coatesbacteria bacterium]
MATFDNYQHRDGVIAGGVYGTDTDIDWRQILKDVQSLAKAYNERDTSGLVDRLTHKTTSEAVKQEINRLVAREVAEGREADIESNSMYEFALPIKEFEIGFSLTRTAQKRIDPRRVENLFASVIQAHLQQRLKNTLRPIFSTNAAGSEWGGTWQANTDCPDFQANTFWGTAHTHIFARTATALTLEHLRMLAEEIQHHGFGSPGVHGEKNLLLLVNITQSSDLMQLADWTTHSGLPDSVVERLALDGINANQGIGGFMVNVSNMIPENYVVAVALDTPYPVVTTRVERQPQYQGLVLETPFGSSQYPFRDASFTFSEGCSLTQPSAVAVLMLGADGNSTDEDISDYVVPEFYA